MDDEFINFLIFKKIFGRKYEVIIVKYGEDGLLEFEKDLVIEWVIIDMNMFGMIGLDFIWEVKK